MRGLPVILSYSSCTLVVLGKPCTINPLAATKWLGIAIGSECPRAPAVARATMATEFRACNCLLEGPGERGAGGLQVTGWIFLASRFCRATSVAEHSFSTGRF